MKVFMAIIVLCVDDNADGLAVRKALLEAKGYKTFTASDGQTGIALAEKHAFDLVVLDYQMPGMDGEEVALVLKSRHPHLPIILLSGFPGQLPERLLQLVDAFVAKGESPAVLLSKVEQISGEKDQRKVG